MNASNTLKSNQMKRTAMPERIDMSRGGRSLAALASAILAVALGLAMSASAGEYWLKATATVSSPLSASNWTNAQGVVASVINTDDILHAPQELTLQFSPAVSHDGAFHAGAEDGSSSSTIQPRRSNTYHFGDFRWHSATFDGAGGKYFYTITGHAIADNPTATHKVYFRSSGGQSGIAFNMNLESSSEMTIELGGSVSQNDSPFVLGGDNSAYLGNFTRISVSQLILNSENALGSPSVTRADALSIDVANAVLSVMNGVTPNRARGIEINKSGFIVCATNYVWGNSAAAAYQNCSSFELPMPISGSYGFTKDGDGTVTLSGDYTAGDIVVANGTLVIASSANFPAGQKISVASGAALYVHQALSGFDITAAEGATVEYVLDTFEVAYNDSMRTATALVRGSSFSIPDGVKQPLSLSSPISLPLHTALQLEVLTVASGAAELSADDFIDETPKMFDLPKTSFEVTTDGAGVQHVYLNVSPVVVSVANFTNTGNDSLNISSGSWSDSDVAKPGYDYLVTNQIARIPATSFSGDSLTIANAVESGNPMNLYTRGNGALNAVIYAGACGVNIEQNTKNGGGCFTISGNLCIAGDYDDSGYVRFTSKYCPTSYSDAEWISYGSYWHRLSANLSGEGPLMLYAANSTTGTKGNPQLYGNNSAYKGKIYVTYSGKNQYLADGVGVAVTFNSANALGGALDTFKYDSLTLDKYSTLRPATSIDFSTENRGIYGSGPFGFDVQDGITFKVGVPVKMDNVMFKHGEGDLILGGTISYGASSTKTCYVREGGIGALNDAAVAGLDVVFSNATKIVIAPDATLVNGFTGNLSFDTADAKVSVGVADEFPPLDIDEGFKAVIATVPVSEGDLSSRFTVERMKGFTGTVVTESVTIGGTPCTRYSVKYTRTATTILIR